jgi:hypothetical protein
MNFDSNTLGISFGTFAPLSSVSTPFMSMNRSPTGLGLDRKDN